MLWSPFISKGDFDMFLEEWISSSRRFFVYGKKSNDVDIQVTGLGQSAYRNLRTCFLRFFNVSETSLPHGTPELVTIPSGSVQYTAQFLFTSYADFLEHSRTMNFQNRKTIQFRKHSLILSNAMKELQSIKSFLLCPLLALDIEAYEFDHRKITEIGLAMALQKNSKFLISCCHFVVKENLYLRNGVRVADAKDKFMGKKSIVLPLVEIMSLMSQILGYSKVLIGHSLHSDLQFLRRSCFLKKDPIEHMVFADTQVLYKAFKNHVDCVRLSKILDNLHIPYRESHLHNAGNDAFYTLLAFLHLAADGEYFVTEPEYLCTIDEIKSKFL